MIIIPSTTAANSSSLSASAASQAKSTNTDVSTSSSADETSAISVASPTESQSKGFDDLLTNIGDAVSFTQTQSGYLKVISKAFSRMRALANAAQEYTLSSDDREALTNEFQKLQDQVKDIASKEFNGKSLFSDSGLEVQVDSSGTKVKLDGIDLTSGTYGIALSKSISVNTPSSASVASDKLKAALDQIEKDQANINEAQSWLGNSSDEVLNSRESLGLSSSRVSLDDPSTEIEHARRQIVYDSNTSILTQANTQPESVFELLQGVLG